MKFVGTKVVVAQGIRVQRGWKWSYLFRGVAKTCPIIERTHLLIYRELFRQE